MNPENRFDPSEQPPGPTPKPAPARPPAKPGELEQNKDARTMAMLAHLLGALLGFLGPLIIWLIKKDEHPFVDEQGKEALNFQLTLLIAYFATTAVWMGITFVTCGLGAFLPLPLVVSVFQLVFGLIGCSKANQGEHYKYPWSIEIIK